MTHPSSAEVGWGVGKAGKVCTCCCIALTVVPIRAAAAPHPLLLPLLRRHAPAAVGRRVSLHVTLLHLGNFQGGALAVDAVTAARGGQSRAPLNHGPATSNEAPAGASRGTGLAVTIDGEVVVVVVVIEVVAVAVASVRPPSRRPCPRSPQYLALVLALAAASQQAARTVLGQSTFLLLPCGETLE